MFDLKSFIVKNIVNGIKNGTFTKEYGNIMAVNYYAKGIIGEEEIVEIDMEITEWETSRSATVEPEVEEPEAEDPEAEEPVVEETDETVEEETVSDDLSDSGTDESVEEAEETDIE